jgi:hypothetical protein
VDERQLRLWKLPGYSAWVQDDEPFPWGWAVLWVLWGLAIGALIIWADAAYAIAGCFVAWGLLMAAFGWRTVTIATSIVHDWAGTHFRDTEIEMAAVREMMEAVNAARDGDEFDEESLAIPNSHAQRKSMQDELFTMFLSLPWFMGFTHGVGFGGLLSALIALIASPGVTITAAAVMGAIGGATAGACVTALFLAFIPLPKDDSSYPFSKRQRILLLVSPLLVVPALVDAAARWSKWYLKGRIAQSNTG